MRQKAAGRVARAAGKTPMALDSNTPVLVGVAAVQQREADPAAAGEALDLMERALRRAGEDAGEPGLLARAGEILVPHGFWRYADPGRALAERLGAAGGEKNAENAKNLSRFWGLCDLCYLTGTVGTSLCLARQFTYFYDF